MEREEIYIRLVCDHLQVPVEAAKSKSRKHEYCEARQVSSYALLLHTTNSLSQIATRLNYKSHASPLRDKKQVDIFLGNDKRFAAKMAPLLIKLQAKADDFKRRDNVLKGNIVPQAHDICWFWNSFSRMPQIGTLERTYTNENHEQIFISKEYPTMSFSFCIYAGGYILPEKFRPLIKDDETEIISNPEYELQTA